MKIIRKPLDINRYQSYEDVALSDYDIDELKKQGFEEVRYFYGDGSYCGTGELIALKDGLWYHWDMGHCSCYGPVDSDITATKGFPTLDALMESCTKELQQDLKILIEA